MADDQPLMPQGQKIIQDMIDHGAKPEDVQKWARQTKQDMLETGADPKTSAKFWGDPQPSDDAGLRNHVENNLAGLSSQEIEEVSHDPKKALAAGFNVSASGSLAGPQKMQLGPDATWLDKLSHAAGGMAGDLPFMVGGAIGAGALASETGPLAPGFAGAGALALPAAVRDVMADEWERQAAGATPRSSGELLAKAGGIALDVVKNAAEGFVGGAAAGAVVGKLGGAAYDAVIAKGGTEAEATLAARAAQSSLKAGAFEAGAFGAGQTIAGFTFGDVPSFEDWSVSLPLIFFGPLAGKVVGSAKRFVPSDLAKEFTKNAIDVYRRLGTTPYELVKQAQSDKGLMAELMGGKDANGVPVTPGLDAFKKPEPKPFKETPPAITAQTEEAAATKPEAVKSIPPAKEPKEALLAIGTNDWGNADTAYKGAVASIKKMREHGMEPVVVLPNQTVNGTGYAYLGVAQAAKDMGVKTEYPSGFEGYHMTPEAAAEIKGRHPGAQAFGDSNAVRLGAEEGKTGFTGIGGAKFAEQVESAVAKPEVKEPMVKGVDGKDTETPLKPAAAEASTLSPANQVAASNIPWIFRQLEGNQPNFQETVIRNGVEMPGMEGRGVFQISSDTARAFGFDPDRLFDPTYAEHVFNTIYADYSRRSTRMPDGTETPWGLQDVAVAYNWGPGHVDNWIRNGRPLEGLPVTTQRYLQHLEQLTGANYGHVEQAFTHGVAAVGGEPQEDLGAMPRGPVKDWEGRLNIPHPNWAQFDPDTRNVHSAEQLPDGNIVPAPEVIADYLQDFGRLANFKFLSGPAEPAERGSTRARFTTESLIQEYRYDQIRQAGVKRAQHVYMPKTPDELLRKWAGLGRYEVLYHEVGHALDMHINEGITKSIPPGPLRNEIIAASKAYAPKLWKIDEDYQMAPPELMANAIAKWMTDPAARKQMPLFTEKYGKKLEPFVEIAARALPTRIGGQWVPPPEQPTEAADGLGGVPATGGAGGGGPPGPGGPPGDIPSGGGRKQIEGRPGAQLTQLMLVDKIMDIVAPETKHGIIPDWLKPAKWFQAFQSILTPIKAFDRKLAKGERIGEDLQRMTFGAKSYATYFNDVGTLKWNEGTKGFDEVNKASMKAAFQAAKEDGGDMKGLVATRLAAYTVEKKGQGIDTGIDLDTAMQLLQHPDTLKKYDRAMKIIKQNDLGITSLYRQSGMINDKVEYSLNNDNYFHIPMQRIIDPEYDPIPTTGTRGFRARQALKTMTGSLRKIIDPVTTEISNKTYLISMAVKNLANRGIRDAVIDFNKRNPDKAIPFDKMEDKQFKISEDDEALNFKVYDRMGNEIKNPKSGPALSFMIHKLLSERIGPNDFIIWENGKPEVWRSTDTDLTEAMKVMHTSKIDPLPELLTKIASLDRAGITGSLDFPFRAILHGQLAASAFAEGGSLVPYHDIVRSLVSMVKGNYGEAFNRALRNGALTSITNIDAQSLAAKNEAIFNQTNTWDAVTNSFKHPIEAMRALSHKTTAMAQVGFMLRNEAKGMPTHKAAMLSRKAYLDYGENFQSDWVNKWSQMVPFMSTGFKDVAQVTEALRRNPLGAITRAGIVLTLPTIANYAVNYLADQGKPDGSKYTDLPQWDRDMYWCIPAGNNTFLKIKKPYVGGWIFATSVEHLFNYMRATESPELLHGMMSGIAEQMLPPMMPIAMTAPLEHITNHDFLTGRPLVSAANEQKSGHMQFKPDTTETAKAISRAVWDLGLGDPSAIVVDNYAKEWLGPLPMKLLGIMGQPFKPPGRPKELADIPFVGSFFARHPGASGILDAWYDRYEKVVAAHANLKAAEKMQDEGEVEEASQNPLLANLGGIARSISRQQAAIAGINNDKTMTDAEKLKYVDELTEGLILTARSGIQAIDALGKR